MNPTPQTPPTLAEIEAALGAAHSILHAVTSENSSNEHRHADVLQSLRDQLPQLFADAQAYRGMVAVGPVGYGFPNTAVTGPGPTMMMVRVDIPSDDQYGGAFWVPLYTLPATAPAKSEG